MAAMFFRFSNGSVRDVLLNMKFTGELSMPQNDELNKVKNGDAVANRTEDRVSVSGKDNIALSVDRAAKV